MPQFQLHVFFCFWFQKGRKSIFSEFDGTKAKVNILPWGTRSQSTRRKRPTRGPHHLAARVGPPHARGAQPAGRGGGPPPRAGGASRPGGPPASPLRL